MLLAAALVVPAFTRGIFDVDEAATMIGAGARHLGPYSPAEAISAFTSRWPDHAWGHVVAFALWGRLVGWSEFAVRVLPWLFGLLTIAWVYRLGRELFSERIALVATLLLATSVLALSYMHNVRPYSAAMLFAAIVLWGYWRIALVERPPGHAARLALLAGATGLLYAHYFGALLLPALSLFHLLFVRKDRRWWQAVLLLALAALFAAVQIPDLIGGIRHNQAKGSLHENALHYPEVVSLLLRYLSSDLLNPRRPFNTLLALALPLALGVATWHGYRHSQQPGAVRFLSITAGFQLLLLIGVNQWLQVLDPRRVRYLATMWPSLLLLAGQVVRRREKRLIRISGVFLVAATAVLGASDFLLNGDLARHSWSWRRHPVSIPVTRLIAENSGANSLLLVDVDTFVYKNRSYEFYTGIWGNRRERLKPDSDSRELLELAWNHDRILLLVRKSAVDRLNIDAHLNLFSQQGWSLHSSWQDDRVLLLQYDSPLLADPADQSGLQFDANVRLTGPVMTRQDNRLSLRVGLYSSDDRLLARYSLAVHVIDPRTGERVAQGDVGVGPGSFIPVYSEMVIGALPAGDYEVHVALYDWQTGERLNARDLQNGAVSDMHVLHRFSIN